MIKRPVSSIVNIPKIQPHGGFAPPKEMEEVLLDDDPRDRYEWLVDTTCKMGSLSPQIRGLVFDYLLRVELAIMAGAAVDDAVLNAFQVSFMGANIAGRFDEAEKLAIKLVELYKKQKRDRQRIAQVASELVIYDAVFRGAFYNPNAEVPKVNKDDKNALDLMLMAAECYLLEKEKIVSLGFSFRATGAENVCQSDGDLLTEDSIIEIKCSAKKPTSKHTLQLLLYYILGMHEYPNEFKTIKFIKVLNPRLGRVYSYEIQKVGIDNLKHIEQKIMGYKKSVF